MNLPEFKPTLIKINNVQHIVPAYLPIMETLLNNYKQSKEETNKLEQLANGVNNVLFMGSFLPTGVKAGAFIAMAMGSGMQVAQAVAAASTIAGNVLSPASSLVNAIVMGRAALKASDVSMKLSRLKTAHYECNCHALGTQSTDPVTGQLKGAVFSYGNLVSKSMPACESLRHYAMKQVDKRADRNMAYATPLVSSAETLRRMGKSLIKKFKGTKGKTRRFTAINLWGAARRADKKNELYAIYWGDDALNCTLDGSKLSLAENDVAIARLTTLRDWQSIWSQGCPLAIGIIHCLLGGDPHTFKQEDWQKTMTTIAAMDGWYIIEAKLASI